MYSKRNVKAGDVVRRCGAGGRGGQNDVEANHNIPAINQQLVYIPINTMKYLIIS